MGEFLSGERVDIPDWAVTAVISVAGFNGEGTFVRIDPGPLTLNGEEVFSYRTEMPHRSVADFLLVVEKGVAKCGCYAERRCLAQRGQENRVEEEQWIGALCVAHSHMEMQVDMPSFVGTEGIIDMEKIDAQNEERNGDD